MASITIKISKYSTVTIEYTLTNHPDSLQLTYNKVSFKNTRSDGVTQKCYLYSWPYYGDNQGAFEGNDWGPGSLPKGTKSKSWSPNQSLYLEKYHWPYEGKGIGIYVLMQAASSDDEWDGYGDIDSNYVLPAKDHYNVVINYNGSGAANQTLTKWYNETLTLPGTPSRTNYTFNRWNTNTSNTGAWYGANASYTDNSGTTLYAIWNPRIMFNANGGTGAPSTQVKGFNSALVLSGVKPTRAGYDFAGWGTSSTATSATYQPGGTVAANANGAMTLYAVWKPKPIQFGSASDVYRTDRLSASDTSTKELTNATISDYPESDEGTAAVVIVAASFPDSNGKITGVTVKNLSGTTLASKTYSGEQSILYRIVQGVNPTSSAAGTYDTDVTHGFVVTVTYKVDSTTGLASSTVLTMARAFFTVDWGHNGHGMAIGGPSTEECLEVYMAERIRDEGLPSSSETPSEDYWGPKGLYFHDKSGEERAYLRPIALADGFQGLQLEAKRMINGSPYYSQLRMGYIGEKDRQYVNMYGVGDKVLWSGCLYMNADHTITFINGQRVSDQLTGIVLVWQAYENNQLKPWHFNYTFVPKRHVVDYSGIEVMCPLVGTDVNGTKNIFVFDDHLAGLWDNGQTLTKGNVIRTNAHWVLVQVIGV